MTLFGARRLAAISFCAALLAVCCGEGPSDDGSVSRTDAGDAGDAGDGSGGAGGTGTIKDASWPGADFGEACASDLDCKSQDCVESGQKESHKICSLPCGASSECPGTSYCAWLPGEGFSCVPDTGNQCGLCATDADCANVGDVCVTTSEQEQYCARDCTFDGDCPSGFTCQSPDASGADGGPGEDAGGMQRRVCVADAGGGCPCDAKRTGATRRCSQVTGGLTCEGTETCNGASGAFEGCTAGTPSPEVCDGADNDCNGTRDDGDDATMCASVGSPPNTTSIVCDRVAGQCAIGGCAPGTAHYPNNLPVSAGCTCVVEEVAATNDDCSTATGVGDAHDAQPGTSVTMTGRLTSDSDVDWYSFNAVDDDEGTTNSFHVNVEFTENPGDEFRFDVLRGDVCGPAPSGATSLTQFSWCVDGAGLTADQGEIACGPSAPIHCGPHTSRYYVRVVRNPGVVGTCARYTLSASAYARPGCDFSQACYP